MWHLVLSGRWCCCCCLFPTWFESRLFSPIMCFVGVTNCFRDWSTNWFLHFCKVSSPIVAQLRATLLCPLLCRWSTSSLIRGCLSTSPVFMNIHGRGHKTFRWQGLFTPLISTHSFYTVHTTLFSDLNSDCVSLLPHLCQSVLFYDVA